MQKFIIAILAITVIHCSFDEGVVRFIVDMPDNVSDVYAYTKRLCEIIARQEGR